MEVFSQETMEFRRHADGGPWVEFCRSGSLSAGLYVLQPGEEDTQSPHTEDEIYVVLAGRGRLVTPHESSEVKGGDVIFVPALQPHRFEDVIEELHLAVVFAPPEGDSDVPA
ncbi:MAG: cupin domain-containing protein [Actinomycetes bacterium]